MLPKNRPPTHPGEILRSEFLEERGLSQQALADRLGVPVQRINTLVNGKRGITPETALLFARFFETSPEFWMNLQAQYDLWHAQQEMDARRGR